MQQRLFLSSPSSLSWTCDHIFNSNKTNLSDRIPGNPKTLLALLWDVKIIKDYLLTLTNDWPQLLQIPDEFGEHLTRDQRPFMTSWPCWCFSSSVHHTLYLNPICCRVQVRVWDSWQSFIYCSVTHFCLDFDVWFGSLSLSWWKIQPQHKSSSTNHGHGTLFIPMSWICWSLFLGEWGGFFLKPSQTTCGDVGVGWFNFLGFLTPLISAILYLWFLKSLWPFKLLSSLYIKTTLTSSSLQICKTSLLDWNFCIIALMVEMGIFNASAIYFLPLSILWSSTISCCTSELNSFIFTYCDDG